jgi:PAS domain-containing protein
LCVVWSYPEKIALFCDQPAVAWRRFSVSWSCALTASPNLYPEAAAAFSLMLAVIASSDAPLVLLDGDLKVIAASVSFCRAFQIDPASVPGERFSALGQGEWDAPQLSSLLEGTASGAAEVYAYEFELNRTGQDPRLLVLNAHKLDYDDKEQVRVLLAVADVTEARASEKLKDNLLREKGIHPASTTDGAGPAFAADQAATARRAACQFHGRRSAILFAG